MSLTTNAYSDWFEFYHANCNKDMTKMNQRLKKIETKRCSLNNIM